MSRPIDRTGLCAWPPCTFWAVRGEYCEEHYTKKLHAEGDPHPGCHKPSFEKPKVDKTKGRGTHRRPDGTPIQRLGDGSLDPGPHTITKAEYYRRTT